MRLSPFLLSICLCAPVVVRAGTPIAANPEAAIAPKEVSAFDQLWGLTNLYEDSGNDVLQKLSLTGRFHGQYHWSDGDRAADDGWETRRFRMGLEAKMWSDFALRVEVTAGPDLDPLFNGFSNLAVQWQPNEAFTMIVGKQAPRFTYDYSTSSNVQPYIERSLLLNQFRPDRAPGVSFQGKVGRFSYYAAVFSNTPSNDFAEEFETYQGGESFMANFGYDVKDTLHTDAADVRLDYLHSERRDRSSIYSWFDNGLATSLVLREGRSSLATEVLYGIGSARGDAWGINLMPGWFVTEKLQLVARYQLAVSNNPIGLAAQRRYERTVGLPPGDLYQAAYAGFNYLIYGPKLRLMGGVEYANLSGHDAWTALLAVRLFWDGELNPPHVAGR